MHILIIEDEAAAARRLRKLIGKIEPAAKIIAELDSVETGITHFSNNSQPDLLFLDIHLADGSSFELLEAVKITCPVIFTTAYDEYALRAFKVNAIDYLLKPIKEVELRRAMDKYRNFGNKPVQIDFQELAKKLHPQRADKRFLLRIGQHLRVVEMKDAAYFYTESKITFLITHGGKRYPIDYSLEQLETMVDDREFFRINRQFIVRLAAISEMLAYSKSRVKLLLNPPCEIETIVSTERSPHFKRWLEG